MIILLLLKWGEFRKLSCDKGQTINNYIICYEKCQVKMRWFKKDLVGPVHRPFLFFYFFFETNLFNDELCLAIHKVNTEYPGEIYIQTKRSLKKYFKSSTISNNSTNGVLLTALATPKEDCYFHQLKNTKLMLHGNKVIIE